MHEPFADRVMAWQRVHGRHDLPWQGSGDAYRVWLSEVMLQQTQVGTVIPYFQAFLAAFPTVADLARAPADAVMALWSGLGYYSRARNLHACAKAVMSIHGGLFPQDRPTLETLPGIGRSTAAAIAVFAFDRREAILDGNVKRVFCRHFGIDGVPDQPATQKVLWPLAERELPASGLQAYTQGLMDLGATLCTRTRPGCAQCPVHDTCVALTQDRVAELPNRRVNRKVPRRRTTVLVLLTDDPVSAGEQVWLVRRPDQGIWGGLHSLPESGAPAAALWAEHLASGALDITFSRPGPASVSDWANWADPELTRLPVIEHVFTHFRLSIEPLLVRLPARSAVAPLLEDAGDRPGRWWPLARIAQAPLPQPIKRLLLQLSQSPRPTATGDGAGSP